ncbi:pinensin family lanthipeptide [Adhaeribacter rhizoryzae]|uniref:Uncharacterized protein n=1 Tax=Adhaeribacter rhizoryzae TaxID=2607907 RepID=A0A5M6D271_9BACT|nr:pinensin family lanthipeptide [Adhaeribacter rhizoryzae]KAA5541584.1 hypothetical protein F0145_20430 [Adhaeribacter rhizoryzae]
MKNQKLNLDELKVQSFVTDFDKEQEQTQDVNGGGSYQIYCVSQRTLQKDCFFVPVTTTKFTDIWSLGCSYGCPNTIDISDVIDNPVVRF